MSDGLNGKTQLMWHFMPLPGGGNLKFFTPQGFIGEVEFTLAQQPAQECLKLIADQFHAWVASQTNSIQVAADVPMSRRMV